MNKFENEVDDLDPLISPKYTARDYTCPEGYNGSVWARIDARNNDVFLCIPDQWFTKNDIENVINFLHTLVPVGLQEQPAPDQLP